MDDAETVRKDWKEKKIYTALEELYSEIWIYGIQAFYDPIREYAIPDAISRKIHFTGYIPRKIPTKESLGKNQERAWGKRWGKDDRGHNRWRR